MSVIAHEKSASNFLVLRHGWVKFNVKSFASIIFPDSWDRLFLLDYSLKPKTALEVVSIEFF